MLAKISAKFERIKKLILSLEERNRLREDQVVGQKLLSAEYNRIPVGEFQNFRDVGWGLYSQHDEDGILLYIFSRIGIKTHRAVEMCAGDGIECNVANLILNHRWTALLVDGNSDNIEVARAFYKSRPETRHWGPDIKQAWLTRDNVNQLLSDAGYVGEVDLLSLDVDGNDYWLWQALTVIEPRVVVLEYNHLHGPYVSVSVPYRDNFVAEFSKYGSDYAGASLAAFIKLGRSKGYRYVGSNTIGTNAFFVRDDISTDLLPEADPLQAFSHPRAKFGMEVRFKAIKDKEWVEV